ncbi:MAG: S9 family peptidase [Candidatus Eremiobacteraeota bacterium]|nr:S9 family peptidase [Candidatus Eremiobacteraeota bacterium]
MLARFALAFGAAAVLCSTAASAGTRAFTVDAALSAPYPDLLTASPDHRVLLWTVHTRGARNLALWKDGTVRLVTHETADDGQDMSDPQLLADGSAVLYARGGSSQSDTQGGTNPNPLGLAEPPSRRIVLTSLASGTSYDVGEGINPVLSPKGDRVAWESHGSVMVATLATTDGGATWTVGKPAPPFTVRGGVGELTWSPDGTRLAFTIDRGDHAWVGAYTLGATNIVYVAPGFEQDGMPAWSPDGTKIAFVRRPGPAYRDDPAYDPPSSAPWSLVVADARSGAGRLVWTADRGMGHAYASYSLGGPSLWWSGDGQRVAFLWEKTGWIHLNSVDARGGAARDLTPGRFEVEQVAPTADGRALLYTSNQGDLDRRHIWRVGFAGGAAERITGGDDSQWTPVGLADGSVAYVNGGWAAPPQVTHLAGGAAHSLVAAPTPREYPADAFVRPRPVTFRAADGLTIHGQLFVPQDGAAEHPALIFDHGGPSRQMLPGYHYMEPYTKLYQLNQVLANRGFVVLSINYRSGIMYGHDFREAKHAGWHGASEYQDVLAGAALLRARPDVDRKHLGIWGLSYGGYLTALGLARNSDIFAAGADQAGISDWRGLFDFYLGKPAGSAEQRRIAYEASTDASLVHWRSPIYLSQADDDRNVPFSEAVDLATRLRERGISVTESAVPNDAHAYLTYAHELARFEETADFLSAHLGARR